MKVVITGGLGFLGQRLTTSLLERGHLCDRNGTRQSIDTIVLFDHVAPDDLPFSDEPRVSVVVGDISDRENTWAFDRSV